jgi:hypothetical protein
MGMINKLVTACMVAQNCEDTIKMVLEELVKNFENIIIVYDDSFDNTESILQQYLKLYPSIKLYKNKFIDIGQQKTYATSMAETGWVIIIDSDEFISEVDFDKYVTFAEKNNIGAYYFKRYNLINDLYHYRSVGFPDNQLRMMRKIHSKVYEPVHHRYYDIPKGMKIMEINQGYLVHLGDIRNEKYLIQKGKDRIKFVDNDECDGNQLKEDINWFVTRKELWKKDAELLPENIQNLIRGYCGN